MKPNKALSLYLALVLLFSISGCVGSKAGAYRVFADDLNRTIGKPTSEVYVFNIGYLTENKPNEIKKLNNNAEQWVYHFKHNKNNNYEQCTVYIEVQPASKIITNASYIGAGCWRAY